MKKLFATLLTLALLLSGMTALADNKDATYGYRGDETVEEQVVYDAEGVKIRHNRDQQAGGRVPCG